MNTFDLDHGSVRGRLLLAGPELPAPKMLEEAARAMIDAEDAQRLPLLRQALQQTLVHATAHPTVEEEDVLQVYIDGPDGRLFACTIVSPARLEQMLASSCAIIEGLTLQAAPRGLDVRGALEAWAARCFPDLPAPAFELDTWVEEPHLELDLTDEGPLMAPFGDDEIPVTVVPDVSRMRLGNEAA
jgi:hypothetical protein